jgi:hypothetical protein
VEQAAEAALGIKMAAPISKAAADAIFMSKLPRVEGPQVRPGEAAAASGQNNVQ